MVRNKSNNRHSEEEVAVICSHEREGEREREKVRKKINKNFRMLYPHLFIPFSSLLTAFFTFSPTHTFSYARGNFLLLLLLLVLVLVPRLKYNGGKEILFMCLYEFCC